MIFVNSLKDLTFGLTYWINIQNLINGHIEEAIAILATEKKRQTSEATLRGD